ncbi:hypothetical protein CEXT_56161 [Caerostris extrusa]|uniref:Uncharacterized protein n=1 Tax=Caerostris extrusa TaxID=172846 RepID=A0AAV4MEF5_CAEEX|nr:hypothetical protein CEXT_56161 [Caerostris extrusa]
MAPGISARFLISGNVFILLAKQTPPEQKLLSCLRLSLTKEASPFPALPLSIKCGLLQVPFGFIVSAMSLSDNSNLPLANSGEITSFHKPSTSTWKQR